MHARGRRPPAHDDVVCWNWRSAPGARKGSQQSGTMQSGSALPDLTGRAPGRGRASSI